MNKLLFILAILLSNAAFAQMQGRVLSVHDGDSFTLLVGDRKIKVRVAGIDCPELDQPYGDAARRFTDSCLRGKLVRLKTQGYDKYHRLLAEVHFNAKDNLQHGLLMQGLAWSFDRYNPPAEYKGMRIVSQNAHRGLFADNNCMPPWEWRHRNDKFGY